MTELDFYKWIKENDPEYRWSTNGGDDDVILWINFRHIQDFVKFINSPSLFDEGGIEVRLQEHGIAIWASDVLDHFGIDLEKIFDKD